MKRSQVENVSGVGVVVDVLIPALVLIYFSSESLLGPKLGLVAALAFPLTHGIYKLWHKKVINLLAWIGVVSVILTGGIGLLELDSKWVAVKETGIPLLVAGGVLVSTKTRYPLVKIVALQLFDVAKIESEIRKRKLKKEYERLMTQTTLVVAVAYLLAAGLNFVLVRRIVISQAGTVEFAKELGKLAAVSLPLISVPTVLVLLLGMGYFVIKVKRLTELDFGEMFKN